MTRTHAFHVGNLRCFTLEGGRQRLDGGAMFGVVPKPLWERRIRPDERNRIPLAMRCLLIEHPEGLVLVDSGAGNKEDAKFRDIYGLENAGAAGTTAIEDALAELGYRPDEIRWVINTHLHFDHAGGNTRVEGDPLAGDPGPAIPSFPNATYVVQGSELEFARHTNERTRASYFPANFEPVAEADRWLLLDGETEVLPGISVVLTPGHIPYHQSVMITDGSDTAIFLGDIIPTAAHLPLPWIMGYDLEPMVTLETKRALLQEAVQGGWRLIFEHDPVVAYGTAVAEEKGTGLGDAVTVGNG
ncbi:MAG: MBL fold metallo-hydrolase [Gemmatimonadales bacterium]